MVRVRAPEVVSIAANVNELERIRSHEFFDQCKPLRYLSNHFFV